MRAVAYRGGALRAVASEKLVMAKLLGLGYEVWEPVVDWGHDLMANGLTVQVKSSSSRYNGRGGARQYTFSTSRPVISDILVCHGITDDLWWVIPRWAVPDKKSLSTSPDLPNPSGMGKPARYRYHAWLDRWDLFAKGSALPVQ